MIVKRVTIVQRFRGGKVGEETVRQVACEQRVMGESSVVARVRGQAGEGVDDLSGRLDGLVVVVKRIHNDLACRGPGAVPPQLFQLQTLPVFAPHVHQQAVVRDAEYPACLRRGHLLVPNVLQRLGQLRVCPRPGRPPPGGAVLPLRPSHRQAPATVVAPPVRRVAIAPVLLWLLARVVGPEAGRAEKSVQRLRFKTIVEIRQKGSPVEGTYVREQSTTQRHDTVQREYRRHGALLRREWRFLLLLLLLLIRMRCPPERASLPLWTMTLRLLLLRLRLLLLLQVIVVIVRPGQIEAARGRAEAGRWMRPAQVLGHQLDRSPPRPCLFPPRQKRGSTSFTQLAYPKVQVAHVRQHVAVVPGRVEDGRCRDGRWLFTSGRGSRALGRVVVLLGRPLPGPLGRRGLAQQEVRGRRLGR